MTKPNTFKVTPVKRYSEHHYQALKCAIAASTAIVSLATIFDFSDQAHAGSCLESAPGSGIFNCSGVANSGTDSSQSTQVSGATNLVVNNLGDFGLDVAANGINFTNNGSATGIDIDLSGSTITTNGGGSDAYHAPNYFGSGDVNVTTGHISAGRNGVWIRNRQTVGEYNIDTQGNIVAGGSGIVAQHRNLQTGGAYNIRSRGTIDAAGTGILTSNNGTDLTTIITEGAISAISGAGIAATNNAGGAISIVVGADTVSQNGDAIFINSSGDKTLNIANGASIQGATNAINAIGSGSSQITSAGDLDGNIVLNTGNDVFNLTGGSINNTFDANDGDDQLIISGGDFGAATNIDGGNNNDTLTFRNVTTTFIGSRFTNWETTNIDGGKIGISDGVYSVGSGAGAGMNVINDGILDFSGNLVLTGDLNVLSGMLSGGNSSAGDTLTVNGNYTGGGGIAVDVDFENDVADMVTINGDVSGSATLVTVNNVGGTTSPTGNDIPIIEVTGSTDASDFSLNGGAVRVGIYDYDLELQGGDTFALTSQLAPVTTPTPTMTVTPVSNASLITPNIVGSLYQNISFMAGRLVSNPTLLGRVGERAKVSDSAEITSGYAAAGSEQYNFENRIQNTSENFTGDFWMRGWHDRFQFSTTPNKSDEYAKGAAEGLKIGVDFASRETQDGTFLLGANLQYSRTSIDVFKSNDHARYEAESYGMAVNATYYDFDGLYADIRGQYNRFSSDFRVGSQTYAKDKSGISYGLSFELGKEIPIDAFKSLVPQLQLNWNRIDVDRFTDNFGNDVNPGNTDHTSIRAGLAYEQKGDGIDFDIAGHIIQDIGHESATSVSGTNLQAQLENTYGELDVGAVLKLNQNSSIFAKIAHKRAFDNSQNRETSASIGMSIIW